MKAGVRGTGGTVRVSGPGLPPPPHSWPPLPEAGFPGEQTALCPGDPSLQADGGEVRCQGVTAGGGGCPPPPNCSLSIDTTLTFARALRPATRR